MKAEGGKKSDQQCENLQGLAPPDLPTNGLLLSFSGVDLPTLPQPRWPFQIGSALLELCLTPGFLNYKFDLLLFISRCPLVYFSLFFPDCRLTAWLSAQQLPNH